MVYRYSPQGNMVQAPGGNYVEWADYEKLNDLLTDVLERAAELFKQVSAGELSAAEANDALRAVTGFFRKSL